MSNNISSKARDGSKVLDQILHKLGYKSSFNALKRRIWLSAGTPAVDANSHATYPVKTGDLVWDTTNSYAFICSVAPTASTAATFVKIHA